jgi:hypothetical protein
MRKWSMALVLGAVLALVRVAARDAVGPGDGTRLVAHETGPAGVRIGMRTFDVVERLGAPSTERSRERGHGCTLVYAGDAAWRGTIEIGAGGHVTAIVPR